MSTAFEMLAILATAARDGSPAPTPIRGTAEQDRPADPAPRVRRQRRRVLVVAAIAVVLVAVAAPAVRLLYSGERTVAAARLRIATVNRGRFISDVAAQGVVIAALSPTLVASAAGNVHYAVRAGESVAKDQLLATVDSPELVSELARERAALDSQEATLARESIEIKRRVLANRQTADVARVQLQSAEREFRRGESAWSQKVISQRDYDKARDDLDAARINYRHAVDSAALEDESLALELRMRRLDRDRQRLVFQELARRALQLALRAPVDGIVGNLAVAERATVAINAPVVTVVDPSVYEVEFTAPDVYAATLRPGMVAEIEVGTGRAPASVVALSPEVRQGQVVGRLRFKGAQPAGLSQNQRLAVRVLIDARDHVLKVERGAFAEAAGGRVAYRVRDDLAERVAVTLGRSSATEIEILSGLEAGDRIVVSNLDPFEGAPRARLTH
jgi:HlyD family secretion protein